MYTHTFQNDVGFFQKHYYYYIPKASRIVRMKNQILQNFTAFYLSATLLSSWTVSFPFYICMPVLMLSEREKNIYIIFVDFHVCAVE